METYSGYVEAIDVVGQPGPITAFIVIGKRPGGSDRIQVETEEHPLQTALELAAIKKAKVEVTYSVVGEIKVLRKVSVVFM